MKAIGLPELSGRFDLSDKEDSINADERRNP
jgi:hypothetical protein